LIGSFGGLSRQERNSKDKAIPSIAPPSTVVNDSSADCDAFQGDTVRHCATHGDTIPSDTSRYRVALSNTWGVPIYITPHSDSKSDIARSATGTFDSACGLDLMSSSYAEKTLGINFNKSIRNPIGRTLTGEKVYSIGVVKARWFPIQGTKLCSPSGDTITLAAKTHYTDFHVVASDLWDIFIGYPSLLKNGCLGDNLPLLNPGHYYVSPAGPTPVTTPAQDQDYLRRMEDERKKVEAARQRRAAAQQVRFPCTCEAEERLMKADSRYLGKARLLAVKALNPLLGFPRPYTIPRKAMPCTLHSYKIYSSRHTHSFLRPP
jgi:hypothetical protein